MSVRSRVTAVNGNGRVALGHALDPTCLVVLTLDQVRWLEKLLMEIYGQATLGSPGFHVALDVEVALMKARGRD